MLQLGIFVSLFFIITSELPCGVLQMMPHIETLAGGQIPRLGFAAWRASHSVSTVGPQGSTRGRLPALGSGTAGDEGIKVEPEGRALGSVTSKDLSAVKAYETGMMGSNWVVVVVVVNMDIKRIDSGFTEIQRCSI